MNTRSARGLVFSALLMMSIAPALQSEPAPQQPAPETAVPATPPAKAEKSDGDRIVCKSVEVTGTRFGKRLCDKKSVWEARTKSDREATDDLQRSVLTACIPTADGLCGN